MSDLYDSLAAAWEKDKSQPELATVLAPDGLWRVDLDKCEIQFNHRFWQNLGYESENSIAKNQDWLSISFSSDSAIIIGQIQHQKIAGLEPWDLVVRFRNADSQTAWIHLKSCSIDPTVKSPNFLFGTCSNVTVFFKKKNEIRRSISRISTALNAGKVGVWEWSVENNQMTWDTVMRSLYGVAEVENISFEKWLAKVHADDRMRLSDHIINCMKNCTTFSSEFRVHFSGDELRYIKAAGQFELDEDGRPFQMIGTSWDVTTERLQAEELDRTRGMLEETNRLAVIGSWEYNLLTNEFICSDVTKQILLLPLKQQINFSDLMLFFKEGINRKRFSELLEIAKVQLVRVEEEFQVVDAQDQEVWVRVFVRPELSDGKCVRLIGALQNIHERKVLEEKWRDSQEQLDDYFDNTLDLHCISDKSGRLVKLNKVWEELLGYDRKWLLGRNFVDFLHPDDVAATLEAAELGANKDIINFVNRYRCADGSYRYIEWRSRPYRDIIFSSARDITERIEYENKLTTAYKEMDSFCYSVSHDLRAPLRSIQGFTQVLKDRYTGSLDGEADRWLGYINENASRMGFLIDDILRFTRLSRSEISRSLVDMKPIIHSVWEDQKKVYPTKELRLALGEISPAYADSTMLYHVWQNLISNAVKYASQNEIIFVEIDEVVGEKESLYRVKDNGVGFDEQYKDKLFGVFQRLHSQEEFEGTGVGLAIVEKIVSKHGGRVDAQSKAGKGAIFSFSIPRPLSTELI